MNQKKQVVLIIYQYSGINTMMTQINLDTLFSLTDRFYKLAQSGPIFKVDPDPMFKDLSRVLGQGFVSTVWQYIEDGKASSIQVNINFAPPTSATFELFITGGSDSDGVVKELTPILNQKFGPLAAKTISRHQKNPLNFKFTTFER